MSETQVEENMKPGWRNLGVSQTIFEDEGEEHEHEYDDEDEDLQSMSSPPLSFHLSSPSPIQSGADAWTAATGRKPDVKIQVRGMSFLLHKDVLISKSGYFKRQISRVSEFTLSPPLKITADTFNQVADFCYTNHAVMTPSNVAALTTAAHLLEMDGEESLRELTESYFCEVITVNQTLTSNVFRSALLLLPEAERTACLASRCIEVLLEDGEGDGAVSCANGLMTVLPEDFRVIADSMQRRYTASHDLIYRVVDLYFLVYHGKISEDQKTQITSCIDCSILSPALLMHAVQNPRMPLRFIVQAMLIEQLNTHRSVFSVLNPTPAAAAPTSRSIFDPRSDSPHTLGAILERDAALRQVAQLRAAVDTTCSRIKTLESELSGMKKLLFESEKKKQSLGDLGPSILLDHDRERSSSCRFGGSNKVERGERGSVSSSFLRFGGRGGGGGGGGHHTRADSCDMRMENGNGEQNNKVNNNVKRNFGQKLIRGLKNAFGGSSNANNKLKDNGSKFNMGIGLIRRRSGFSADENHTNAILR